MHYRGISSSCGTCEGCSQPRRTLGEKGGGGGLRRIQTGSCYGDLGGGGRGKQCFLSGVRMRKTNMCLNLVGKVGFNGRLGVVH